MAIGRTFGEAFRRRMAGLRARTLRPRRPADAGRGARRRAARRRSLGSLRPIDPPVAALRPRRSTSSEVARRAPASTRGSSTSSRGWPRRERPCCRARLGDARRRRPWRRAEAARLRPTRTSARPVGAERAGGAGSAGARSACARPIKTVDTCAAEFAALTPYYYSTYEDEDEVAPRRAARDRGPRLAARTASARASSSTTAACTPPFALREPASRR